MSLPLPHLVADWQNQANFQAISQAFPDLGGRSPGIRWGTTTVTFGGVNNYEEASPSHGLGKTPLCAFACANDQDGTGHVATMTTGASSTTVTVRVATVDSSVPANGVTTVVSWLVIG